MSNGLFIAVLGAGGTVLDPGGQAQIVASAKQRGLDVARSPYQYTDTQNIYDDVRAFAKAYPTAPIILEGDSCGANVLQQIIADLAPLKIALAFFCQASLYCNFNYPDIKANCARARVIYSDGRTLGLGQFVPKPEVLPSKPVVMDGWEVCNNGATLYRQNFIPAPHPDDNDPAVQALLFADVEAILEAIA